jgi:thioredoxin reductase/Pyruvate/2-oxoacid:ferredoxin oxidoreductase delta subunit
MDTIIYLLGIAVLILPAIVYGKRMRKKDAEALAVAQRGEVSSDGPQAQHPRIDAWKCIGCGTCVDACPEGDVLAVVFGKAAIVNGHKCIGHGLCADACPVGAIEMVMAKPSIGADTPNLSSEHETNVENMFVAGELGGLALIKNAVNQGRECIDTITARLRASGDLTKEDGVLDVCVVGAGPAGISASLRALENKLACITLEQDEVGGTVAKYPRQKLVMTSPVEIPLYGKFRKLEIPKEDLMQLWGKIFQRTDLRINTGERVEGIERNAEGVFSIRTTRDAYRSRAVVLALGRRGTPRKLGAPGEELSKVMYSLIEASAYTNKNVLVVGGGDSAVEAAMALAFQEGNRVTVSYRKDRFSRIKERNAQRIQQCIDDGKIKVVFNSNPAEIREHSVVLDVGGVVTEIENDYVWIFAGGTPPSAFLQKAGVALGCQVASSEHATTSSDI